MAEFAIALAFALGGAAGFFIGRASAPKHKRGTAPGGRSPQSNSLS